MLNMTMDTQDNAGFRGPILILIAMILGIVVSVSAVAEEPQPEPPPLRNRALTGTVDFGSGGRQVTSDGLLSLGTLTLTSESFAEEVDLDLDGFVDEPLPSFSINVAANGYAFLSNDLLIRSSSATDVQFDGPDQSHTFDVFRIGTGTYDYQNAGLSGNTSFIDGGGNQVTAYGGNWFWEADYTTIAGETETVARTFELSSTQPSRVSPLTLNLTRSGNEIDDQVNRATSIAPRIPSSLNIESSSPLQFRLVDDQTPTLERQNTLLSVASVEDEALPVLTLNAGISGAGSTLGNRTLTNSTVNLGRFIANQPAVSISQTDTLTLGTRGSNDDFTQIQLNSFDVGSSDGSVTANFDGQQVFDEATDTASVTVTGNFDIDSTTGLGARSVGVDASSAIASVENLPGESLTGLNLGYRYSVVENNELESNDITWFSFEGAESNFNSAQVAIGNDSIRLKYSTETHTRLSVPSANGNAGFSIPFDDNVHTRTLSEGNGVTAEGLDGENVIATTTFDVHRQNVQAAQLSATESGTYSETDSITFGNDTELDVDQIQGKIFLVNDNTTGSTRWTLPGLDSLDLSAGGSLTINPTFNDSGLSTDQPGGLGRRFRTSIELTFQNGVENISSLTLEGTDVGRVGAEGRGVFNVLGSQASQQTRNYVFERSTDVQATTGTTTLAFGTTLGGEGISLENTLENTSELASTPTTFRVLDSDVLTSNVQAEVTFVSLDDVDSTAFADTDTTPLLSDIVEFTGLDGTLHVVDLSFDPAAALVNRAEVLWLDDNGLWVNAVLGNSNIEFDSEFSLEGVGESFVLVDGLSISLADYLDEQRFDGSYDDYFASLEVGQTPELGVFGSDNQSAWAIIDHNSAFALAASSAIPEPSSVVLLGLMLGAQLAGRRRR